MVSFSAVALDRVMDVHEPALAVLYCTSYPPVAVERAVHSTLISSGVTKVVPYPDGFASVAVVTEAEVSHAELPVALVARILTLYAVFAESPVTVALDVARVNVFCAGVVVAFAQPLPLPPQFDPVHRCIWYPVASPEPVEADIVQDIEIVVLLAGVAESAVGAAGATAVVAAGV